MTNTLRGSPAVRELVAEHAYIRSEEPFTLSSGAVTHDYIDAKQVLMINEYQAEVGRAMAAVISERGIAYDSVGGLELGAIYVAQALLVHEWAANRGRTQSFVVRKKPKIHGTGLQIEGPSLADRDVIVVDDVVTTGDSLLRAVDAVTAEGARVVLAITVVDRGDIAGSKIELLGVPYHPLTTYRDYGIAPIVL